MRLKARCEDYRDDKETIDIFTEESRRRRWWVSPRVPMPGVIFDGEPEQQSAQASKHETEDDSEWKWKAIQNQNHDMTSKFTLILSSVGPVAKEVKFQRVLRL